MPVFETGAFNHSATCPQDISLEKYRVAAAQTTDGAVSNVAKFRKYFRRLKYSDSQPSHHR